MHEPLLAVRDLEVAFATGDGVAVAVDGVSFTLERGEVLAIAGESGCGKSTAVMTLMGLTRGPGATIAGSARLRSASGGALELIGASETELRRVRGSELAMVFQDAMSALNPVMRVGDQVAEQVRAHEDVTRREARERAVELLGLVGVPRAAAVARSFPHELSGGMRQRAMLAMAFSCEPSILIADEPTTALDVTVQAHVLERIRELGDRAGAGVVLVTHDLGVVAGLADRVAVMYAGQIVEEGTAEQLFHDPQHPYTWGLLGSLTRLDGPRPERLPSIPGAPPSPVETPAGCRFGPRCPHRFDACREPPSLARRGGRSEGHRDRCVLPVERRWAVRDAASGGDAAPPGDGMEPAPP